MNFVLPFFSGFLTASVGIPGLINMTAAKISIRDGRERALMFILGALIIIFSRLYRRCFLHATSMRGQKSWYCCVKWVSVFSLCSLFIFSFSPKRPKNQERDPQYAQQNESFFLGMLLRSILSGALLRFHHHFIGVVSVVFVQPVAQFHYF
jgi:threonine/homoserine/homoserine lactone efflux protein